MKTKHVQAFPLCAFCSFGVLPDGIAGSSPLLRSRYRHVKGKVIDKADGEGVYGASVVIAGTTIGTATDMNGNFTLQNVPAKQQKISVSIVGYAPASQIVNVGTGQTAVVNLSSARPPSWLPKLLSVPPLYKQDRLDVPVTTNVVSKEKIKEEPNPSLDKVIEDVPGVNINRSSGYSASTVQIRGSNTFQGGGIGTRVTLSMTASRSTPLKQVGLSGPTST